MRLVVLLCFFASVAARPSMGMDCENVIVHSQSKLASLHNRAEKVKACIEVASELARQSYQLAYGICQKQVNSQRQPKKITLPNGKVIHPKSPEQETWESFAMRLGVGANESGCRDGILSGLLQQKVIDTRFAQEFFERTALYLPNGFNGNYDIAYDLGFSTIQCQINVTESNATGRFTGTNGITVTTEQKIRFDQTPFTFSDDIAGVVHVGGLLRIPVRTSYEAFGRITGLIDGATMQIRITDVYLDSFVFDDTTIEIPDLAPLDLQIKDKLSVLNNYLTDEMRRAYAEIDPFAFLADLKHP
ncbi:MAG TPA: hypothetical protein VE954_32525 [Oligoflexus sp.]|uniref:hypothetical protein n=1 Tax=Oligoflexus sp. TaxID=1971216 RepID=UPI002D3C4494|nr:hypothetical protein [Oligoflexus sp.]HYX37854.1 hypothetical protein [Oligoflexus sp.]